MRCWSDTPLRGVVATGGFLVVLGGLLSLTALGVYTHNLGRLGGGQRSHPTPTSAGGLAVLRVAGLVRAGDRQRGAAAERQETQVPGVPRAARPTRVPLLPGAQQQRSRDGGVRDQLLVRTSRGSGRGYTCRKDDTQQRTLMWALMRMWTDTLHQILSQSSPRGPTFFRFRIGKRKNENRLVSRFPIPRRKTGLFPHFRFPISGSRMATYTDPLSQCASFHTAFQNVCKQ